jgi:hypothetical protein
MCVPVYYQKNLEAMSKNKTFQQSGDIPSRWDAKVKLVIAFGWIKKGHPRNIHAC